MHRPENRIRCAIGVGWLLAACSAGVPQPVEIAWNEDACEQCRMAISQPEFAAEIVERSGAIHYFDDIGCMVRWREENTPPENSGLFVTDYDTEAWLDARAAYYVRSSRLPTPMSYGLAAFGTRAQAQVAAKRLGGKVIQWAELVRGGV